MARITITHTHEDGTLLAGSRKGDGVYEIVRKHGFEFRRGRGICINVSRDRNAKTWHINPAVGALREAGHEITIDIDNTPRPTDVVEAERAERVEERADRLAERSHKANAAGDARLAAARNITDGIPFGQPVLVDHYSAGRHINALNRADNHRGKAVQQWRKAEHLANRSRGSVANQAHRTDPRTTMRRIETLEADKRRAQRDLDGYERNFRNGRGELWMVEKHEAATGGRRTDLERRIAHLDEQITYWRSQLDQQNESGLFVPWGKDDFAKGDQVRHHGFADWYEVTRVNAKSVSVASNGWPRTINWDKVAGRRRDGMQWNTPNGEPWPVELARKVGRWHGLERALGGSDSGNEAMWRRIHVQHAQRIVLGLPLDAAAAQVQAYLEGVADVAMDRRVKAAFVDVYDRLTAGEKTPEVKAAYPPIELAATWRMPDREPERRPAARGVLTRHDSPAVKPGDLIVGLYDWGMGKGRNDLIRSFCGPIAAVSDVNDRREAGEFVTITLVDGTEKTVKLPLWFAVHPAGTWEQDSALQSDDDASDEPEQALGPEGAEPTGGETIAEEPRSGTVADGTAEPPTDTDGEEPDPWGPLLDEIEATMSRQQTSSVAPGLPDRYPCPE